MHEVPYGSMGSEWRWGKGLYGLRWTTFGIFGMGTSCNGVRHVLGQGKQQSMQGYPMGTVGFAGSNSV